MQMIRALLLLPLCLLLTASLRGDQVCPSTSEPEGMTDLLSCGTGGTPGAAYVDALLGFDDIPPCGECDSRAHYCLTSVSIQPYKADPSLTFVYDPVTGLWTCCISVDKGTTFTQECEC